MRLLLVVFACFLSFSKSEATETRVLTRCDNVADETIKNILVKHVSDFPANLFVSVLYRDNSRAEAIVGTREWRLKSFTLPSREPYIYRLKLQEQSWILFWADSDKLMHRQIDCQTTSI